MSAARYSALKDHLRKGQRLVIDDLVEHLWPHPPASMEVGWRTLYSLIKKFSKRNKRKTAHVFLCILDEFVPRFMPVVSDVFAQFVANRMMHLRSFAHRDWDIRGPHEWFLERPSNEVDEGQDWGADEGDSLQSEIHSDLYDVFIAIFVATNNGGWLLGSTVRDAFKGCAWMVAATQAGYWEPYSESEWEDDTTSLPSVLGRIFAKFAFADAQSAILE